METFLYQESELSVIDIKNLTLKNKIMTLKNLTEMKQMTLNDPNFNIKKLRDNLENLKCEKNKN